VPDNHYLINKISVLAFLLEQSNHSVKENIMELSRAFNDLKNSQAEFSGSQIAFLAVWRSW